MHSNVTLSLFALSLMAFLIAFDDISIPFIMKFSKFEDIKLISRPSPHPISINDNRSDLFSSF